MPTTPRLALPYPALGDPADGPDAFSDLATALDSAAIDDQGTLANRPVSTPATSGIRGRYYYVTGDANPANNGKLWRDHGTGWALVGSLEPDSVGTLELKDNAVEQANIADAAVGTSELVDSAVTTGKLAGGAVTAAKINDALKPSAGAAAGTEALRAIGPAAGQVAAGTHTHVMADITDLAATAVVATTVAGLGAGVNGKIGLIRSGSSPYAFTKVVYDSTYGKWVSEEFIFINSNVAGAGNLGSVSSSTYTDVTGNHYVAYIDWRIRDTSGLKPQFRYKAALSMAAGAVGGFSRAGYRGVDTNTNNATTADIDGATTAMTSTEVATAVTHTNTWFRDAGWVEIPAGYTVRDHLRTVLQIKGDGTNACRVHHATVLGRWVG